MINSTRGKDSVFKVMCVILYTDTYIHKKRGSLQYIAYIYIAHVCICVIHILYIHIYIITEMRFSIFKLSSIINLVSKHYRAFGFQIFFNVLLKFF